jgi:oligosaccharide reducing-end xylanase
VGTALGALCVLVGAGSCAVDTRSTSVVENEPESETASNRPGAQNTGGAGAPSAAVPSVGSAGSGSGGAPGSTPLNGGAGTGMTANGNGASPPEPSAEPVQNLFVEVLGVTEAEVDAKLTLAVERVFGIGTGEPGTPTAGSGFRLYYELPQNPSRGFIWTSDSDDVRSEALAYGMMIAVQMDLRDQFDRLWNFAREYSQFIFEGAPAAWNRYFRWQGALDRTDPQAWNVDFPVGNSPNPRADTYFAAALYVADRRWGSAGGVNYQSEAEAISRAMLNNPAESPRTPDVDATSRLVVSAPSGASAAYVNTGHQLPAFYELFAADGPPEDSERWRQVALASRPLLAASANPTTGLHPDFANFDGTPNDNQGVSAMGFSYDAWPVVLNMTIDSVWFGQDAREPEQIARYHAFFASDAAGGSILNSVFTSAGVGSGGPSTGLSAALAAGALVSTAPNRTDYVRILWELPQRSGTFRTYDELLYTVALLTAGGRFSLD